MPYIEEWIDPEVFLTHQDVTVYCTYKDNDFNQGAHRYSFTTNGQSDDSDDQFDVRELSVPNRSLLDNHPPYLSASSNPAYADASDELKTEWKHQWAEWHKAGEKAAIQAVIKEAIEMKLIFAPTFIDDNNDREVTDGNQRT